MIKHSLLFQVRVEISLWWCDSWERLKERHREIEWRKRERTQSSWGTCINNLAFSVSVTNCSQRVKNFMLSKCRMTCLWSLKNMFLLLVTSWSFCNGITQCCYHIIFTYASSQINSFEKCKTVLDTNFVFSLVSSLCALVKKSHKGFI